MAVFRNRLIGFFDILGFGQSLCNESLPNLHARFGKFVDFANAHVFSSQTSSRDGTGKDVRSNFEKTLIAFDSILLVSQHVEDVKNIGNFIFACLLLLERAFQDRFPLRGCIGLGDFLDDPDRRVFLSSALPGLLSGEKRQKWTGAYLTAEASALALPGLFGKTEARTRNSPLVAYAIPVENSGDEERWCLNWPCFVDESILQENLQFLEAEKLANTKAFLDHIGGLPDDTRPLDGSMAPAVRAKVMAIRSGFRIKFLDAAGRGVDPPGGFSFVAVGTP